MHRRVPHSSKRRKAPLSFSNRHTRLTEVLSHDNAIQAMLSSTGLESIDRALHMSPQRQTVIDRLAIRARTSDIRPTSTGGSNQRM